MKAIAAMALNRVIGCRGRIPWHLPEDFKWFKRTTTGHAVLMGRKTFESLGRALPNRTNIVVSRTGEFPGLEVIRDLAEFDADSYTCEVFVIGGAEIYRQALPCCTDLYLSVVKRECEGETLFPPFEEQFTQVAVLLEYPEFEVRHYRNRDILLAV